MLGLLLGANNGPTLPGPTHPWWYGDAHGGFDPSTDSVTPDSAMRIAAVYACVKVLAESVATLPLITYRRRPDGGKERAQESPIYEMLHDQPNPWQTSTEFFELGMYQLCLRGNMLARKHAEDAYLTPIDPDTITAAKLISGGRVRYERSGDDGPLSSDDLLHVRGLAPDSLWGLSPVKYMRQTLSLSREAERFGERYFREGMRPAGTLEFPNALSDKAFGRLRESLNAEHAGQQHRAMILEEGGKWATISIAPEEAQFLETRQFSVAEIARIFRVPPHMIQDLTHATFSNIEHQGIDFVVHTLRPWLVRIERALRRDVIDDDGLFCEFLADALVRGDMASRYNAYSVGITNEFLSPNEVRAFENMNPRDGGDEFVNPAINPKNAAPSEPPPPREESPEEGQARRIASAFARDIAGRIASRELKELEKRAKHAAADGERWSAWLQEFYTGHSEFVDSAVGGLCGAMGVQEARRVEIVEGLVKSSIRTLREGDAVETVERWRQGEARASEYARVLTEAVL